MMDFMFDWDNEGDRFSFDDSDRFEEDSLCSWISEPESLCNNWRGWKRQNGGPTSGSTIGRNQDGQITSLVELAAQAVACHIPFEIVEHFQQPMPEQLQLRLAFWSFPESEEDIRLYSCLANGSADEFQKGEHLYKARAVKDALQIGFHLSATVIPPQSLVQAKGNFSVAVVFDRRRITSCTCTCSSTASWCSHVVSLCLYRIHQPNSVTLRAPVSESLSRLHRDQLQKFAQYLISELPQQILPTAQRLLDELLSSQKTDINTLSGAPDPTAGPSANEQTSWCLDENTLHDNVKKTLVKFCVPAPIVYSDVNYLSATAPPAAAEWQSLLRPLRGREPEGMWNLLSIVREMFRRNDGNGIPLLEIITDEVLQCEQILAWWFTTKLSSNTNSVICRGGNNGSSSASQHAAASLCDEIVTLWRLAALNPKLSPIQKEDLSEKFKEWHMGTIEKVRKTRNTNITPSGNNTKKGDIENFLGFKPGIESCQLTWDDYPIPGVTYSENDRQCLHFKFRNGDSDTKKPYKVHSTVCSENLISTDNTTTLAQASNFLQEHFATQEIARNSGCGCKVHPRGHCKKRSSGNKNDGALSSGSEGFCEPERSFRDTDSGSEMKDSHSRSNSIDEPETSSLPNHSTNDEGFVVTATADLCLATDRQGAHGGGMGLHASHAVRDIDCFHEVHSSESQPSGDEYQMYFYDTRAKMSDFDKKKREKNEEPNYFAGVKAVDNKQEVLFARAEALHAHGHTREACKLAQQLADDMLNNPPDLLAQSANVPTVKGKKKKALTSITLLASSTLSRAAFLSSVLSEVPDCHYLAFKIGMFGLELPRPPASTKALEVKLAYQETELLGLLKKIPLGNAERTILRERSEHLRDGTLKSRGEALLPLTLASFIFDSLCLPACPISSINGKPALRSTQLLTKTMSDEKIGFEGTVAALGMKANVSEAEHPLLCESTRRQRGELAIAMLFHYKDDQVKLSKIMDKLLDKEVHQLYKAPSLVNYLSIKPVSSHSVTCSPTAVLTTPSSQPAIVTASAAVARSPDMDDLFLPEQRSTDLRTQEDESIEEIPTASALQQSLDYVSRAQPGQPTPQFSSQGASRPKTMYSLYNSGKDTDSSALEEEGDEFKALEAKLRCMSIKKKPSQGMASIDSSAPETTSSDNSPTIVRRTWGKHQGPGSDSGSSGDSDSLGSSSSGDKDNRAKLRDNESPPSPLTGRPIPHQLILDSRSSTPNIKSTRFKGKNRIMPTIPNQPSEASAHFMFELAKTVLAKAGGTSSTSMFNPQPSAATSHSGPHKNLHLCAFQIGLYALGLNNCVSPNWLSRTYSSHVSWITGQAMEIGAHAINILIDTWEGHTTPPEIASLSDRASRCRDPAMVRAAAELALSCLPHAHALNPSEVQRALFQCKDQSGEMLEKACSAVENAAKGGGVYPEVLFDVARRWYELSEEAGQRRGVGGEVAVCHSRNVEHKDHSKETNGAASGATTAIVQNSVERNSPSTLQVIPFSSTSTHNCSQVTVSNAGLLPHGNGPIPAQAVVLPYAITQASPHPAQLPHQPYVQTYNYVHQLPYVQPQYTHQHIPLHSHNIHPYIAPFQYQNTTAFSNIQAISNATPQVYSTNTVPFRSMPMQVFPSHTCQIASLPGVHGTPTGQMHSVHQAEQVEGLPPSGTPPQIGGPPPFLTNNPTHHNQEQLGHLLSSFRVGMLGMETLARRVHDDRPQTKYARNPPYGEDVKWLLGVAIKLGTSHLQQFCASAVNAVLSPFILYDIAVDSAHILAKNNPAAAQNHLRSNILNPLVQKCLQMFIQCAHHRIHHISPADYDDFVSTICSARNAFCLSPGGMVQFQELLQSLRRSKSCRKDLWQRIVSGLATGNL